MPSKLGRQLAQEEKEEIERGDIDDTPYFRNEAFPPAPASAVRSLERRLKFAFPPSYRGFLGIHNGWRSINGGDISALGVSGRGYDRPDPKIKEHEPRSPLRIFQDAVAQHEKLWRTRPYRDRAEALRRLDTQGQAVSMI